MSDQEESSSSDMDCDDVTEGATVRVVQSSMHASIKQNSLFKVIENKKESDNESEAEPDKPDPPKEEKVEEKKEEPQEEIKKEPDEKPEEIPQAKIEEKVEITPDPPEQVAEIKPEPIAEIEQPKPEPVPKKEKVYSKAVMKILSDKKPKKQEKIDVEKRFYEYQRKVNEKIQNLQEEKDREILESCTFTPQLKTKSQRKNFEYFLDHVARFEKNKKEKIQKIQKEKQDEIPEKSSFKPTLSSRTIKLTKKCKSETNIHERLYKESSLLKVKQEELSKNILALHCTFKPKIESSVPKREGDTKIRLFNLSKQDKETSSKYLNEIPKVINEESENLISSKFSAKVEEAIQITLARDNLNSPESCHGEDNAEIKISFNHFVNLLVKLKFLHPQTESNSYQSEYDLASKAWAWLGGDPSAKLDLEKIRSFILSTLNLTHSIKCHKIHIEFLKFYQNQQNYQVRSKSPPVLPSFKPEISQKSKKLAAIVNEERASNIGNKKIENVLHKLHQEKLTKLEKRRETLESLISPECTFKPQITRGPRFQEEEFKDSISLSSDYLKLLSENKAPRNETLYCFYKIELERKEKLQRTSEDWEIEKNMGECSFVPDLDKPKFGFRTKDEPKGTEETVDRLRKAREDRKSEISIQPMKFGIDPKPLVGVKRK